MYQSGYPRNWHPSIHVIKFGLPCHNVSSRPLPPGDLTTLLSVLQLSEAGPVGNPVFNHLIDAQRIEKRILVEVISKESM